MRIHVASFDADESEKYNQENCTAVLDLVQRQPGVTARYWCEKGRFRLQEVGREMQPTIKKGAARSLSHSPSGTQHRLSALELPA
jgi:hypothetical protein